MDYDFLVVGAGEHSKFMRMLAGSTASKLVRECPCPIWVATPKGTHPLRNVLVSVDFPEISDKALALAALLAHPVGATIHLLYVFELVDATYNVAPGIAWQLINTEAHRVEADLIVIGSVGRGGLPRLLTGNSVEKVLHTAGVPFVVVKPDGFVSRVPIGPVIEVLPRLGL